MDHLQPNHQPGVSQYHEEKNTAKQPVSNAYYLLT